MNVDQTWVDAFVDGALSPEEAAALAAEADADAALAERIAAARALRAGVADDQVLSEPAPQPLTPPLTPEPAAVQVVRRGRWAFVAPMVRWGAVAASIVAAFAVGRYAAPYAPAQGTISVTPGAGLVAGGVLAQALQAQLAATQSANAPVKIGLSFQANDGAYCRTFTLRQSPPVAGLACHGPGGWRVRMADAAGPAATAVAAGLQTAGDATPAAVLEAVDQDIRGEPLDAAGEVRARTAGWR